MFERIVAILGFVCFCLPWQCEAWVPLRRELSCVGREDSPTAMNLQGLCRAGQGLVCWWCAWLMRWWVLRDLTRRLFCLWCLVLGLWIVPIDGWLGLMG